MRTWYLVYDPTGAVDASTPSCFIKLVLYTFDGLMHHYGSTVLIHVKKFKLF